MSISNADPLYGEVGFQPAGPRCSGRSTRQILGLKTSGVYIVENGFGVGYGRDIAAKVDRNDVRVVPLSGLERIRGQNITDIVVDHYVKLNDQQRDILMALKLVGEKS